jgi:C4-dicarboxylate-binding protein DctP
MTARCIGLCLALFLSSVLAAEAQQVKLRLTSQLPSTHHIGKGLVQFRDEVERRSGKTLAIEIFDNSRLYKDNQVVGAVSSGAIEMGLLPADQLVEKVPAIAILQQPFLFNFYALVKAAADPERGMRPLIDKAILDAIGSRVLMWLPFGSTVLLSKQRPTLSPSDISEQKVRVLGKTHGAFIEQCGGVSAIIPAGDQLAAVQEGRADMLMTGVTGVAARHLWKVTDTITRTEHATFEMLVIIKESVWQSLSDSQKAIMGEAARKVDRELHDEIAEIEDTDYRFSREKGMKIYGLTPDQVVEWRACSAPVLEDFMTSAGAMGEQLMDAYGKLRLDPCCSAGPEGTFTRR